MNNQLKTLLTALYDEADKQDGYAQGQILSGNVVKEHSYRGAAAGLRMAAGIATEVIKIH